ncbi:MAG: hypothetical protein BWX80_00253 [Candidatus Hydrogenedentes bacterium ADurb.Bin101]|jgi:hypothetical protein|nr:MAG: hypothetical protein BWX80_00253 [Candidatus Hydrogenedentes bacterium ADurb.Bin101]HOC67858.1 hypothetical protein [Candidatus Hydrogenedentota bacterium]
MKRFGHVFEAVIAFQALYAAAQRAVRANRNNGDALRFMFQLEPELFRLQRELENGDYQPGPYNTFTIRLSRPSLVRCRRKLKRREDAFAAGRITEAALIQSAGSLIAHISHANTTALRRQWFRKNGTVPAAEYTKAR